MSSRHYTETHGQQSTSVEYRVSRVGANDTEVSSLGGASTDTIRWRPGVGTYDWQLTDPTAGIALHAVRNGDVIHVTGTLKKRPVDRDVKVDRRPGTRSSVPSWRSSCPRDPRRRSSG